MNTLKCSDEYANSCEDTLLLPGLDGANPLGFLAALGLLCQLRSSFPSEGVQMRWTSYSGTWVPLLKAQSGTQLAEENLLATLDRCLLTSIEDHPARLLSELGVVSEDVEARRALLLGIATGDDRYRMEWAAALASDVTPPEAINQLQTARRDYFEGNIRSVLQRTDREHLRRTLFHPWDYADALDNQSLHWDPSEDRRHALQWNKPAGDPNRKKSGGMLGANRLALEAIPLFTSMPLAGSLRTLGFTGDRSTNTRWTWPLWNTPIALSSIRSLLAEPLLQAEMIEPQSLVELRARGVVAIFRTQRILVGKTPNFTPPLCIA